MRPSREARPRQTPFVSSKDAGKLWTAFVGEGTRIAGLVLRGLEPTRDEALTFKNIVVRLPVAPFPLAAHHARRASLAAIEMARGFNDATGEARAVLAEGLRACCRVLSDLREADLTRQADETWKRQQPASERD